MKNKFKLNNLKIVKNKKGNLKKIINSNSNYFYGFEELYISKINKNEIKAWKVHSKMTCNLLVIRGKVKFVIVLKKGIKQIIKTIILSENKNSILTIFPNTIFGFQNNSNDQSEILNFSNLKYNKKESLTYDLEEIKYDWK